MTKQIQPKEEDKITCCCHVGHTKCGLQFCSHCQPKEDLIPKPISGSDASSPSQEWKQKELLTKIELILLDVHKDGILQDHGVSVIPGRNAILDLLQSQKEELIKRVEGMKQDEPPIIDEFGGVISAEELRDIRAKNKALDAVLEELKK